VLNLYSIYALQGGGRLSMFVKLPLAVGLAKRPILVGGLGLSASLWLTHLVQVNVFDASTLVSAIALGSGIWWWRHHAPAAAPLAPAKPSDRAAVEQAIAALDSLAATLAAEIQTAATPQPALDTLAVLQQQIEELRSGLDRQSLRVGLMGEPGSGKSTLLLQLSAIAAAGSTGMQFQELPLPYGSPAGRAAAAALDSSDLSSSASAGALPAGTDLDDTDALLFLIAGDLSDSAYQLLRQRLEHGQPSLLVFNKQDQYLPADREQIAQRLSQRLATLPLAPELAAIAAQPRPLKVRRHHEDGRVEEWLEPMLPDLSALTSALERLSAAPEALVLATSLRQSERLRRELQQSLNQVRRQRALPLVEQLQWVAAATAFASPVPSLDLLAAVAVNGQLVMDLGQVYGVKISLEEAKAAAGTLAGLTVKLGLVELSSQALTAVLKSHAATYVAGGLVQGLSAAYLTRLAGLSLIETFEAAALAGQPEATLPLAAIAQRLQSLFQQGSQNTLLRLVQQGLERLRPAPASITAGSASPV
jgi:uncharacterized protein